MGRKVALLVCTVLLVFSVSSVLWRRRRSDQAQVCQLFPADPQTLTLFAEFCQDINKKSGGKVNISYYPGGTLLSAPKMAAGVLTGIADIGLSHFAYSRGRFP